MKVITLLPLAFEALLALSMADAAKGALFDHIRLVTLIDTASKLEAMSKTYALFADMILSSALPQDSTEGRLLLPSALILLQKVIAAIRKQQDYDIVRAARWIRCVVQMVLDHQDRDKELKMVEKVVDEALILARTAGEEDVMDIDVDDGDGDGDRDRRQVYPSDELEWLSTVLFNLAVDFYIKEDKGSAKMWAEKAVGVADVLASNSTVHGGDGGLLGKCLKEKCGKMGFKA